MRKYSLKTFYKTLELTNSMEQRLYRVRDQMIGKMPRGRGHFNPIELLRKIHGNKAEKIEILDSEDIEDNWEDIINKNNPESPYFWNRMSEKMKEHEEKGDEQDKENEGDEAFVDDNEEVSNKDEEVTVEDIGPEDDGENTKQSNVNAEGLETEGTKKKPKRVLAYTTKELLKLFEVAERSSVDGTFKSICKLWKQPFIWMLKVKGKSRISFVSFIVLFALHNIFIQVTGFLLSGDGFLTRQKLAIRYGYINIFICLMQSYPLVSCVLCHVSRVTCHVSRVTCHVSRVTCHVSPVTCHLSLIMCQVSCVALFYYS